MSNAAANLPSHLERPYIRPFQPMPIQTKDGQTMALLRDPAALGAQSMIIPPQVLGLLHHFRGEETLAEMFERFSVPAEAQGQLVDMVRKLDELGYLWGPTSEALEAAKLATIRAAGRFSMPEDARKPEVAQQLGEFIDACLAAAEDPELGAPVAGVVAPILAYGMCKDTYGAAYKCLQADKAGRPDRVVILGTNHFGIGDGVVMTEFGFETPFGAVRQDAAVLARVRDAFGEKLFKDQLDFAGEHSIAHQLPWIQRLWGDVPVVAALVPDPGAAMIEDDGARIGSREFAPALRRLLEQAGGRTVFVACADLSHRGMQFGDQKPVDPSLREAVEQYDREAIGEWMAGADQFLGQFKAGNPNRWTSVGSLWATLVASRHSGAEMIRYEQVVDPQGSALVSTAAVALLV
jgi:AmmeMemoRadiSam system protein B